MIHLVLSEVCQQQWWTSGRHRGQEGKGGRNLVSPSVRHGERVRGREASQAACDRVGRNLGVEMGVST